MRIVFVFPMPATAPVGGYKVVYEYANHLVAQGHDITIAHKFLPNPEAGWIKNKLRFAKWLLNKSQWRPDSWFLLDPRVKMRLITDIEPQQLPNAEVIFATSWETAEQVAKLPERCGRKYYLIQHFESWSGQRARVLDTWRLPLEKIVISRWLAGIAAEIGETTHYVQNGLSMAEFFIETPLVERDPNLVGTLYHKYDWKGFADVMAGMEQLRLERPELKLLAFGASPNPGNLPEWVEYHQSPSGVALRKLYNRMSLFLSASWEEGWGLTPCEALLCGCPIVVADNGGHREFALSGQTALLFPVKDISAMVAAVSRLLDEPLLRQQLAAQGEAYVRQLTWERATSNLLKVLEHGC